MASSPECATGHRSRVLNQVNHNQQLNLSPSAAETKNLVILNLFPPGLEVSQTFRDFIVGYSSQLWIFVATDSQLFRPYQTLMLFCVLVHHTQ